MPRESGIVGHSRGGRGLLVAAGDMRVRSIAAQSAAETTCATCADCGSTRRAATPEMLKSHVAGRVDGVPGLRRPGRRQRPATRPARTGIAA